MTRFLRLSTSPTADTTDITLPVSDTCESEERARLRDTPPLDLLDKDDVDRIDWVRCGVGDPSVQNMFEGLKITKTLNRFNRIST